MPDSYYWDVAADQWQSKLNGSSNLNNGVGPRLQIGQAVSGTDTYKNRFFTRFQKPSGMSSAIPVADIVSVTWYGKARGQHGCFSNGGSPKLLLQRSSATNPTANEGTASAECTLTGTGTNYGSPATTATDQVGTSLSGVAVGDVVGIDITAMFKAYWALRGSSDDFTVVGMPANTALNAEEDNVSARKFAFSSADADGLAIFDGGSGPYLLVLVTPAGVAPSAPTLDIPIDGGRPNTAATRTLFFTYHHPNGDNSSDHNVVVATNSHLTGGALDTSIVANKTWADVLLDEESGSALLDTVADFAPDEAQGTTYYWQVRSKANGLWGPFAAPIHYVVNRSPVNTKVRPA